MAASQISLRHFGRKAVAALARKGITITGLQALPGADGTFFNPETGYLVDDNGCGRVWTHREVAEATR
jgi:hypothetical protein